MTNLHDAELSSYRSRTVAQILAFFLGMFGAHRFYAGKFGTGVLQACTLGGMGLWWLYDNILIATGSFRDKDGLLITQWEPESERALPAGESGAIYEEIDQLRAEIMQLQDRLEFAERLLADPMRREPPRP